MESGGSDAASCETDCCVCIRVQHNSCWLRRKVTRNSDDTFANTGANAITDTDTGAITNAANNFYMHACVEPICRGVLAIRLQREAPNGSWDPFAFRLNPSNLFTLSCRRYGDGHLTGLAGSLSPSGEYVPVRGQTPDRTGHHRKEARSVAGC